MEGDKAETSLNNSMMVSEGQGQDDSESQSDGVSINDANGGSAGVSTQPSNNVGVNDGAMATNEGPRLEGMERVRKAVRRRFLTLEAKLNTALSMKEADLDNIKSLLNEFIVVFGELTKRDDEIRVQRSRMLLADEEEDAELEDVLIYHTKVATINQRVANLEKKDNSSGPVPGTSTQAMSNIKFAEIELEKFSGEYTDYLRFWGQYKKIHDNPKISESDKMLRLLHAMEKGSPAYEVIAPYAGSDNSYQEAVEALQRRFGNKDLLLQVYIRDLLTLCINNGSGKDKLGLDSLYSKVDASYRALRTLELAKADPEVWLYPLVESALPDSTLTSWQRSIGYSDGESNRLKNLLEFMEKEVRIRQYGELTRKFTSSLKRGSSQKNTAAPETTRNNGQGLPRKRPATSMGLHNNNVKKWACIFCKKENHRSQDCPAASKMTREEKQVCMKKGGCCFYCLYNNHLSKDCRNKGRLQCDHCGKAHLSVLCQAPQKESKDGGPPEKRQKMSEPPVQSTSMTNQVSAGDVCLQTLRFRLICGDKEKVVRAFLDTGSSRSYIIKGLAKGLGLTAKSEESVVHGLFGGLISKPIKHNIYELAIQPINKSKERLSVTLRDERQICSQIKRLEKLHGNLKREMESKGVWLSDIGHTHGEIEVLIGADLYGQLITGRKAELGNGLIAIETKFGWTLTGEVGRSTTDSSDLNMTAANVSLQAFWELDSLGIRDPYEVLNEQENEEKARLNFYKDVTRNSDGRYEVRLPWKRDHPELATNKSIALQRLRALSNKLKAANLFDSYNKLFKEWEAEGFIEKAAGEGRNLNYSPHRAVIKAESATTPVRPVFDCSCKPKGGVSLNDCLHKGKSYILKIPNILLRFRERRVGFVADIRKAFQMIGVHPEDRDALRFLWWSTPEMKELQEYRHARVPFGATCSPFILGAILELHILSATGEEKKVAGRLWESLYVDNCCSSEDTQDKYDEFKTMAVKILASAQMDLRMWLSSTDEVENNETQTISVLGLRWNRKMDALSVNIKDSPVTGNVTKRAVLLAMAKVYDPLGFVAPALLPVKVLLQRAWVAKLKWDEPLPPEEERQFLKWNRQAGQLNEYMILRVLSEFPVDYSKWELHSFSDGSKTAYAAVSFLRIEHGNNYHVKFLSCRARLAPVKDLTIPRLELMGCLVACRQAAMIEDALKIKQVQHYYWTDSTTALAWIRRNDQWGTFVGNRVAEIVRLSNPEDWHHVPGEKNPADLPSRGCMPSELIRSSWPAGPAWLYESKESWPMRQEFYNEEDIGRELRKTPVEVPVLSCVKIEFVKRYPFRTIVRIQGWVRRFLNNYFKADKRKGPLKKEEIDQAEVDIIKKIQESFQTEKGKSRLKTLETFEDVQGVIRIKTRLTHLPGDTNFRFPAVLPGDHPTVQQLIYDSHIGFCHAGVGFLMSKLRQKYWILKARQSIKYITAKCYRCRKITAKPTVTQSAPLPIDRIRNAEVFEVTGVDLAGPLITKNGKKVWLVLFTCAVYRAVAIYVINSLSTSAFLGILHKFVDKFGRPAVIYSDNGTNFRGTDSFFRRLDWTKIEREEGVTRIGWKFNPPTASWWGGWWERLIGVMKNLLRKEIGGVVRTQKELVGIVKRVEAVMNRRPLTYISEDPNDLEPLTPNHFLRPLGSAEFPEADMCDGEELRTRYGYLKTIKDALRIRLKKEYIALLISRHSKKITRPLKEGELVIVAHDNMKRSAWPLGRILELMRGSDGVSRVARVKTKDGELVRPVQRLYALEADQKDPLVSMDEMRSKYGRKLKRPERFEV